MPPPTLPIAAAAAADVAERSATCALDRLRATAGETVLISWTLANEAVSRRGDFIAVYREDQTNRQYAYIQHICGLRRICTKPCRYAWYKAVDVGVTTGTVSFPPPTKLCPGMCEARYIQIDYACLGKSARLQLQVATLAEAHVVAACHTTLAAGP